MGLDVVGAPPEESPQASEAHETLNHSNLPQAPGPDSYVRLCEEGAAVAPSLVRVVEFTPLGLYYHSSQLLEKQLISISDQRGDGGADQTVMDSE